MAYGRNFGFRRFTNLVREGRLKTPANTTWLLGTAVEQDPATPGVLRRPPASQAPNRNSGILLYEHIQKLGNVDAELTTSSDYNYAPGNSQVQVLRGAGAKVWFKNTTTKTLYDGRQIQGLTIVAGMGATPTVAVGDYLTPAADGTWVEGTAANGWLQVTFVDIARQLVEAELTF